MGMLVAGTMLRSTEKGHGEVESDDPRPKGAELSGVAPGSAGEIEDVPITHRDLGMDECGERSGVLVIAVWI
jgi:hypothetical protein